MKKIIAVILTLILTLTPLTAFATMPVYDATWAKMGDVNIDGRVNAADARLVLRMSAKLDSTEPDLYRADADANGKVNATDARTILRVSAGLSQFTCGFDGNRVPCVVNTLKSGKYYIEASYDESGTGNGKKMSVKLAKNGDDVYFASDDIEGLGISNPSEGTDGPKFTSFGMLMLDNTMHAIFGNAETTFAIPIPEENSGDLGIDADTFLKMSDLVSAFFSDNIGSPVKVTVNGVEGFCYSYTMDEKQYLLYVDSMGRLLYIDGVSANGDIQTLISFDKVSGDIPTEYFDIENYSLIEFF